MTTTGIIRKNMFPNARCVENGADFSVDDSNTAFTYHTGGRNGFMMRSTTASGPNCRMLVAGLQPGVEYVASYEVEWNADTDVARAAIVSITSKDYSAIYASDTNKRPYGRYRSLRFTAPSDGVVFMNFNGPKESNAVIAFYDIQLELASTYDAAVSGGGFASSPGTPCRDRNGIRRAGGAR